MTPAQLARSNSEHAHQRALFAWANMAEAYGFAAAWDECSYTELDYAKNTYADGSGCPYMAVDELRWFHAIPNGGLRDKRTAAMLKAEGVKRGVPDTSLPVPMYGPIDAAHPHLIAMIYAGLYLEMKRPDSEGKRKGRTSDEQEQAVADLRSRGYAVSVCFEWDAAAREVQSYIEACQRHRKP